MSAGPPIRTPFMEEKENHPSWPWVKWFQSIGAQFIGLRIYANNAAAVAGGLKVGDLYRTGADPDLICVVH